jgi:hypothetical protein
LPGSVLRHAAHLSAAKPFEVSAPAPSKKKKPSSSSNSKKKKSLADQRACTEVR